ncbi:hypothetical protein WKN59_000605 [Escherichia coli]|uniref:Protein YabR n=8 Tax=Enterobacteriaceae TaxID=543 RepID=YABR_ECOLI|nr:MULTISPECIES: protein YabR [Enterobacteriaceae]YP_009518736.1 protein YabR [Escherichia coli str. K-12 substr. MG1655]P0DPM5.1 RecName: Full=Protein YabR [Escherichia coli K-12]EEV2750798.1 hypothetical protein [Escherichia coli O139]EEY7945206.1 hypothetical protein [Escherichia coli H30]EEZ5648469.1 hypothetical protein [Escherichia coli O20]EEZ5692112.1 hypothetical protein [Escherichia coli O65]EEZ5715074.1 hypothetical protein [Escherichia coli O25]EEZ5778176.1 hypothetical protein 
MKRNDKILHYRGLN